MVWHCHRPPTPKAHGARLRIRLHNVNAQVLHVTSAHGCCDSWCQVTTVSIAKWVCHYIDRSHRWTMLFGYIYIYRKLTMLYGLTMLFGMDELVYKRGTRLFECVWKYCRPEFQMCPLDSTFNPFSGYQRPYWLARTRSNLNLNNSPT